jgi:hypothetical protein
MTIIASHNKAWSFGHKKRPARAQVFSLAPSPLLPARVNLHPLSRDSIALLGTFALINWTSALTFDGANIWVADGGGLSGNGDVRKL